MAVQSSMPSRFSRVCQGQWGHRNTTRISFDGSSTKKVEGVLPAVHPTSFPATFQHPKETNAKWDFSGEREMHASETKLTRRVAILPHNDGAC